MPRKFKKKRMMTGTNGEGIGWEEFYDYQFPDDSSKPANLKILEMAQKWKDMGAGEAGLNGLKLNLEGAGMKATQSVGDVEEIDLDDEEVGGKRGLDGDAEEEEPPLSKRRLDVPANAVGEEEGVEKSVEEGNEM